MQLFAIFILTVVLVFPCFVEAQPTSTDPPQTDPRSTEVLQIEEVLVSDTRLFDVKQSYLTVPANVTVITADDIKQSGARTVQEAIQKTTGLILYDQVGNAFQQTIDLRGFNGQPVPSTSVFVDGIRVNEPDFNTVNFDLLPLETIDRIEILPGASAIYGKNALGGVINITTKRGTGQRSVTGETAFGSFARQRYNIHASGPIGKFDYYANATREMEDGFRNDSGARISRFFGKLGFRPTDTTDVTVSYTYVKDNLQQAGSLPISIAEIDPERNFTPGDFFAHENNFVRLSGRQVLPLGLSLTVKGFYRRLGQDLFTVSQPFAPGGAIPDSRTMTTTESRGAVGQLSHDATVLGQKNVLTLGAEFTRNDFSDSLFSRSGTFVSRGQRSTDEDVLGLYAQNTLTLLDRVTVTTGIRYDHDQFAFTDIVTPTNNGNKAFNRLTPRVGLSYLLLPTTSLYFSFSQGFRVPTFFELFALGPFGSNQNLKPVRSNNFEIGFKTELKQWGRFSVALFRSDVEDEILLVCGSSVSCGTSVFAANQNIDNSRRQGIETSMTLKANAYLDGVVNYTFTEATFQNDITLNPFFSGPFGFTPFVEQVQKGDSFPQVPKNRLSATMNVHPVPGLTLSLTGLYVSTQFLLNDEQNSQERLPGYFVLNGHITYERPVPGGRLKAFLSLNNILDRNYFTSGIIAANNLTGGGGVERFVVPVPGLAVFGGISYRFENFSF